jgi:hypothetical protein
MKKPAMAKANRLIAELKVIRSPPARAVFQDIEWAGMSQRVSER